MNYKFSARISTLQPSAIREILKATSSPDVIPLAAGNPAPEAFPIEEVRLISQSIFENRPVEALQYGVTEGYEPLRKRVLENVKSKGIGKNFDNILITSGAQQVMDLAVKVFCNEEDTIICETPSFIGSLNCFRSYRLKLRGVEVEADGINVDMLEKVLKEEPNVKIIYTIPNFQNPSGATMSLEKRQRLYSLAQKYNVMILEDNPYGDLRVEGEDLPTIKSMDTDGRVIYAGSFSKILAPGIRVGYAVADSTIIGKMTVGKQTSDVHTPIFNQMLVEEWMAKYDFESHIKKIQNIYRDKLNIMSDLLDSELSDIFTYVKPQGGLFVWCKLPDSVDMMDFCKTSAQNKVAIVPGTAFTVEPNEKSNHVRLNFSTPSNEKIVKGLKILSQVKKQFI